MYIVKDHFFLGMRSKVPGKFYHKIGLHPPFYLVRISPLLSGLCIILSSRGWWGPDIYVFKGNYLNFPQIPFTSSRSVNYSLVAIYVIRNTNVGCIMILCFALFALTFGEQYCLVGKQVFIEANPNVIQQSLEPTNLNTILW